MISPLTIIITTTLLPLILSLEPQLYPLATRQKIAETDRISEQCRQLIDSYQSLLDQLASNPTNDTLKCEVNQIRAHAEAACREARPRLRKKIKLIKQALANEKDPAKAGQIAVDLKLTDKYAAKFEQTMFYLKLASCGKCVLQYVPPLVLVPVALGGGVYGIYWWLRTATNITTWAPESLNTTTTTIDNQRAFMFLESVITLVVIIGICLCVCCGTIFNSSDSTNPPLAMMSRSEKERKRQRSKSARSTKTKSGSGKTSVVKVRYVPKSQSSKRHLGTPSQSLKSVEPQTEPQIITNTTSLPH